MQFFYGSYKFDANQVQFTKVDRTVVEGENRRQHLLQITWGLRAKIVRTNQSAIMSELATIQRALGVSGFDAGFLDDNGAIINAWYLRSIDSAGGLLVTQPACHDLVAGAEGITYLYVTFTIQGFFPYRYSTVLSFRESLIFDDVGGGPLQIERIPAYGLPILQNITSASWYRATQSGSMTQNFSNPAPIPPLWPALLRRTEGSRRIEYFSPKMLRGVPIEWGVSWKYDFISAVPIGFGSQVHVVG